MSVRQTYGRNLPDQVDCLANLSTAQLELISDVRELYRDRAALEREYASKLQVLAGKAGDKKSKQVTALVVGTEPTKTWDEDVIQKSTLENAYSQLITSMLHTAQDHINLADTLNLQVVDALKATERRHEEATKKQMQYFQKLLSERDRAYTDRVKNKRKYDDECTEVESYRQKQERSTDDRHAERAAKQYEQQQVDMLNSKNVYLISIVIANHMKTKFYNEDLPALEDQFQDLQSQLLTTTVSIMLHAQEIHKGHLEALKAHITAAESMLGAVSPSKDQDLFIEYNIKPFTLPQDWSFEPNMIHYDSHDMSVEAAPKVVLQNRLGRCRTKLQELNPVLDAKRKEVEQLKKLRIAYSADRSLGDVDEISDNYLEAVHQFSFYTTSEYVLKAEIDTITTALGGDEGAQSPHTFKSSSFSIPTTCVYCKSSIWGLSKQGKTCKACGISVHSKCELKIPADCPGNRSSGHNHTMSDTFSISRSSSTVSRSDSHVSSVSTRVTPTPSSFTPTTHALEEVHPAARVLFDFSPTSPFELAVFEGTSVEVLEEDDGSGWVKVADNTGGKGLVPSSYIQFTDALVAPDQEPPTASEPSGAGRAGEHVRGIYQYQAQGPDEISLQEGELITLTDGLTGGRNYADGWWEGIDASGKKGIFPSNYVELVG
ncbi:hypothetical protein B0H21DRAFT_731329 [Amylocystis lapponica]|nr:hypothetical protein B0H21DRAFT_731329 [Amylocystis lapponica]